VQRMWNEVGRELASDPARGYKSSRTFVGDQEAGVAQPQRGSMRSEVSDLQNIVDRLDLLMGSSAEASTEHGHGLSESAREQIESSLADLASRVGALERETEELRTLVNHLMTIATWQAKVTATLVGDDESGDAPDANAEIYSVAAPEHHAVAGPEHHPVAGPEHHAAPDQQSASPADRSFVDRVAKHVEPRRPEPRLPSRRSAPTTLDDDIDDILGTDRDPSSEDSSPPPDFGI
jgi:ElaB/YqjD/DUF883 family membrane-anchored ribosome-binding protein